MPLPWRGSRRVQPISTDDRRIGIAPPRYSRNPHGEADTVMRPARVTGGLSPSTPSRGALSPCREPMGNPTVTYMLPGPRDAVPESGTPSPILIESFSDGSRHSVRKVTTIPTKLLTALQSVLQHRARRRSEKVRPNTHGRGIAFSMVGAAALASERCSTLARRCFLTGNGSAPALPPSVGRGRQLSSTTAAPCTPQ